MIQLLGRYVLLDILGRIRSAYRYSLIADEATDISNKEQFAIVIRWVDNAFDIHEDPIELINVPKTDAETLTKLLKRLLNTTSDSISSLSWAGL